MVRLVAIAVLLVLVFVLLRYRASETVQKAIVWVVIGITVVYIVSVFVMELIR